ncbi:uncharacterized protein BDR25DRAFT_358702 [Lindgomyces ingoldianus]|uniref:Uncharacterized protein n=1 Tax=Lindgomyces ingoldianus TaxID=673940 RepID=A0ACB6QLG7_9PLEO|nr:uncharacterized protein BDR25DRAFT_358702 [Lindgomyces ingoldianus]KAF2467142.1 hypothetical protein BDR25DRAFT_358702 [Lindgomyces ingoldianus]
MNSIGGSLLVFTLGALLRKRSIGVNANLTTYSRLARRIVNATSYDDGLSTLSAPATSHKSIPSNIVKGTSILENSIDTIHRFTAKEEQEGICYYGSNLHTIMKITGQLEHLNKSVHLHDVAWRAGLIGFDNIDIRLENTTVQRQTNNSQFSLHIRLRTNTGDSSFLCISSLGCVPDQENTPQAPTNHIISQTNPNFTEIHHCYEVAMACLILSTPPSPFLPYQHLRAR